jgi:uncharacterized protein
MAADDLGSRCVGDDPGDDPSRATRVGLISDTHGWLDPRAIVAFEREQPLAAILHAGDIGAGPQILLELGALAPLTAVLGNCDAPIPGFDLGTIARLRIAEARILVIHDFADLGPIPDDVDVVVRGHSHIPSVQWHGHVLVLNPGSATQRRNQPSCTVAILEIAEGGVLDARIMALDDLGPRLR